MDSKQSFNKPDTKHKITHHPWDLGTKYCYLQYVSNIKNGVHKNLKKQYVYQVVKKGLGLVAASENKKQN